MGEIGKAYIFIFLYFSAAIVTIILAVNINWSLKKLNFNMLDPGGEINSDPGPEHR